ncbi:MAG: patatin-like phospholipase family protein [Rhodomicrobium sp.]
MSGSWLSRMKWAGSGVDRRSVLLTAAGGAIAAMAPAGASAQAPQPIKRALLLGGGSIKGAYQAGAIKVLLNKGFVPDSIYGISVGSLNAAFLCDRAYFLGKPKSAYYSELKETAPANAGDLSAPVTWPFIGDQLEAFWTQKVTDPSKVVKEWPVTGVALHALFSEFNGFLSVSPLKHLIDATVSDQRLQASKVPTSIGAVNIDTTNIKYVLNTDADFKQFILASAALPLVMPIAEIKSGANAGRYVDGGAKHIVPVKDAAAAGPATHMIAIVCQAPLKTEKYPALANTQDVVQLARRLSDIASDNVIERDLGYAFGKKIAVIRPAAPLEVEINSPNAEINNFKSADISNLIARGEYYAEQKIKEGKELTADYFS